MKLLGRLDVAGVPYSVRLCNEKEHPEIRECFGYCSTSTQEIFISDDLSPEKTRQTLIHELLHAIWEASGLYDHTASAMGVERRDPRVDRLEEVSIRIMTPHLIKALDSLKKWR